MNWHLLRADLNGSQQKAFEEVCAQLARVETDGPGTTFVRLGTPDGGVECYRIAADGSEHGWQAKFFMDNVGKGQFAQITESFERALATHPSLTHYTICIPQDRADPRFKDKQFYMDRWNDAVESWRKLAEAAGRTIDFDYWGDHELTTMLVEERHAGRRWLWFREVALTQDWLREQFGRARRDAGERYDPQLNVPVRIAESLTGLLREKAWFDDLNAFAGAVDEAAGRLNRLAHDKRFAETTIAALTRVNDALSQITRLGRNAIAPFESHELTALLRSVEPLVDVLRHRLRDVPLDEDESRRVDAPSRRTRHIRDYEVEMTWRLDRAVDELVVYLNSPRSRLAANGPFVLLGDAGAGKTHLLCDAVDSRIAEGSPAILFLGKWFREGDPLQQMIEKLDLDCRGSEFLDALASLAEFRGRKALLAIDALNEAQPRDVWSRHLGGLLETVGRRPWIAVVVSCRTSYVEDTFPDGRVPENATSEIHRGFGDELHDAVRRYFDHYGVVGPRTPLVLPEFRNPLFLRIFCRALRDAGLREVPVGMQGISRVFEFFISAVDEKLHRPGALNYPKPLGLLQRAIAALADAMVDSNERRLSFEDANAITERIRPSVPHWNLSLLNGLIHEGVLVREQQRRDEGEYIAFQYERLGDHLIASRLLEDLTAGNLAEAFTNGRLRWYTTSHARWDAPGILESLAVQLPERFGVELHDYAGNVERAFFASLVWRSPEAFNDSTWRAIQEALLPSSRSEVIYEVALTVAGAPLHPLNALFLDRHLRGMTMVERDAIWTTYINEADDDRASSHLVRWALATRIDDVYDPEALVLVGTALAWLLTSSNRRLRDTATKGLGQLCTHSVETATTLLERFADVNDPYVLERVSAAAYGAATRSTDTRGVARLARAVYEQYFSDSAHVPVHLLTRDYLRGIVELAHARDETFQIERARPPYGATFADPPAMEELERKGEYEGAGDNPGLRAVWFSVRHHDFARYIIGTNSGASAWLPTHLGDPLPPTPADVISEFEKRLNEAQGRAFRLFRVVNRLNMFRWEPHVAPTVSEAPHGGGAPTLATTSADTIGSATGDTSMPNAEAEDDPVVDDSIRASLRRMLNRIPAEFHDETLPPRSEALASLRDLLPSDLRLHFEQYVIPALHAPNTPDRFDLGLVQRSVMDYVLQTGYSVTLSRYDEDLQRGDYSREPRERERIGKKYQWQGLYSCLARIADNFIFKGSSWSDTPTPYDGPWQTNWRNIDPTFIAPNSEQRPLRRSDEHWERVAPAVSSGMLHDASNVTEAFRSLFRRVENDGTWVLLDGDYDWREAPPLGRNEYSVHRREVWTQIAAYLVHTADSDKWFQWAVTQDWWNHWMPETPSIHDVYRGEFYWANSYQSAIQSSDAAGWTRDAQFKTLPIDILVATVAYSAEGGSSDASIEQSVEFSLPCDTLVHGLVTSWNGDPWAVQDAAGRELFSCRETGEGKQMALWGRLDVVLDILTRQGVALAWTILAEARTLLPSAESGTGTYDGTVFCGTAVLTADGTLRLSVQPIDRNAIAPDEQLDDLS